MSNFNKLLDEINKRILLTEEQILHSEKTRNSILKIENILNVYNIKIDNLNIKNIVKINVSDLIKLKEEINYIDDNFYEKVNNFIDLTKLSNNDKSIIKSKQYRKLNEFVLDFIMSLKNYAFKYKEYKTNHMESLREILENYKNTSNKFLDGKLNEPILDMLVFNDVVNKCGFDLKLKSEIKREIGIANYDLIFKSKEEEKSPFLKYEVMISKNKTVFAENYENIIKYILNNNIQINNTTVISNIKNIYDNNSYTFEEVRGSLVAYLMEIILKSNDNENDKTLELEKAVLLMNKEEEHFNVTSEFSKTKQEELLNEMSFYDNIIKKHETLLKKYGNDNNRFNKLKELSLTSEDLEVKFVLVIESIRIKTNENKNFNKITMKDYNNNLIELNDFYKAYEILKKRV